jgi:hypothetical protein
MCFVPSSISCSSKLTHSCSGWLWSVTVQVDRSVDAADLCPADRQRHSTNRTTVNFALALACSLSLSSFFFFWPRFVPNQSALCSRRIGCRQTIPCRQHRTGRFDLDARRRSVWQCATERTGTRESREFRVLNGGTSNNARHLSLLVRAFEL